MEPLPTPHSLPPTPSHTSKAMLNNPQYAALPIYLLFIALKSSYYLHILATFSKEMGIRNVQSLMNIENYLNHPTWGLLYRVCLLEENQELFTTLYAQRLFFLVTTGAAGLKFEPISRSEARLMLENRLRILRRTGQSQDYDQLQTILQRTFQ